MFPTLLSIGPLHVSSFWIFTLCAWVVFSFQFWRQLKNQAIAEESIYQLMFYGTIAAFIGSRFGFVFTHWPLFSGPLWIRIFTIWIQPGYSFYAGFIAGGAVMLAMSRQFSIPRSLFLDAFTTAFASAFPWGAMAAFLEGSIVGIATSLPLGIRMNGQDGLVHPLALYEISFVFVILFILYSIRKWQAATMERSGMYALWFFLLFSVVMFCLEFMKEGRVYFLALSYNQWICIGIFGEAAGALITWGGGKEFLKTNIPKLYKHVRVRIGGWYAKFSKRTPVGDQKTA